MEPEVIVAMNKQFEAGILVAVAVLVTMSASTVYYMNENGNTNPVDRYVAHEWQVLSHWVKNNAARTSGVHTPESEKTAEKKNLQTKPQTPVSALPAFNTNTNETTYENGDTYRKLAQIGTDFVDSMSPGDWQTLVQALTKDDAKQADDVVMGMIQSHIKRDDRTWLEKHFMGSQNFDVEDVSLLQSSIKQAMSELTPQEMSLLSQVLPNVSLNMSP